MQNMATTAAGFSACFKKNQRHVEEREIHQLEEAFRFDFHWHESTTSGGPDLKKKKNKKKKKKKKKKAVVVIEEGTMVGEPDQEEDIDSTQHTMTSKVSSDSEPISTLPISAAPLVPVGNSPLTTGKKKKKKSKRKSFLTGEVTEPKVSVATHGNTHFLRLKRPSSFQTSQLSELERMQLRYGQGQRCRHSTLKSKSSSSHSGNGSENATSSLSFSFGFQL